MSLSPRRAKPFRTKPFRTKSFRANSFSRQNDLENGAAWLGRGGGKLPGMTLDDHPANGQAQSHAVRLRRHERVEYAVHPAGVNSGAGIFDLHRDSITVPFGAYLQRPLAD